MFVNYMYQKMSFFDNSLIKTFVNFVTVKYNPSLISCDKVDDVRHFDKKNLPEITFDYRNQ